MRGKTTLKLGTRASRLALAQAALAARALRAVGIGAEILEIATAGDADRRALWEIGGQGVFTAALEEALIDGKIDVAVHSAKDLPTKVADGLVLGATLPREDPRDALVSANGLKLSELAPGAVVATSSTRRAAAVLAARPDLVTAPIRGNVPTRLKKVADGEFAAAILAVSGLKRLGLEKSITEVFACDIMVPAPGQGAIGLETRAEDTETAAILREICDDDTLAAVRAERALLDALGAGCRMPVGGLASREGDAYVLRCAAWTVDGRRTARAETTFRFGGEEDAGREAARLLGRQGFDFKELEGG